MKKVLPNFPKFEKLKLDHKDLLQAMVSNFPSSDFNFAGLFTWDVEGLVEISSLNDNLIMRSADYLTHEAFYTFLGDNNLEETIMALTKYSKDHGEQTTFRLIPESVAIKINPVMHKVIEDRDNHDYIYRVSDLSDMVGSKYRSNRRRISRFTRLYGSKITEKELDLNDEKTTKDIESVMAKWQKSRRKHIDDVRDEFVAINKALTHHKALGMRAFGIFDAKELIAFQIFEILPGKVAIGHFEKADSKYVEVFSYLKHALAKHLSNMRVETYNTEQDLGLPGLRKSKEMDNPASFIKKYTVTRK